MSSLLRVTLHYVIQTVSIANCHTRYCEKACTFFNNNIYTHIHVNYYILLFNKESVLLVVLHIMFNGDFFHLILCVEQCCDPANKRTHVHDSHCQG